MKWNLLLLPQFIQSKGRVQLPLIPFNVAAADAKSILGFFKGTPRFLIRVLLTELWLMLRPRIRGNSLLTYGFWDRRPLSAGRPRS